MDGALVIFTRLLMKWGRYERHHPRATRGQYQKTPPLF